MADHNLEQVLTCPVCFEQYQENGDHVPRWLPCHHTMCTQCIKTLIDGAKIQCPMDKKQFQAPKKEKSFPQNADVLTFVQQKSPSHSVHGSRGRCERHGRELSLYCKDHRRALCTRCISEHKKHRVVPIEDVQEERKQVGSVGKTFPVGRSSYIPYLAALDGATLLIVSKHGGWKMATLSLETGETSSVDLGCTPYGVAVVQKGGRKVVAVSDSENKRLDFYNSSSLQVTNTHSVAPSRPGRLCTSPPSTLLYSDRSTTPAEVHIIDCGGASPRDRGFVTTRLQVVFDMCVVREGGRELVVCVGASDHAIHAYNLADGDLEFKLEGRLEGMGKSMHPIGVTTDGEGVVYVCDDKNKCVHVFDGRCFSDRQVVLEGFKVKDICKPCQVICINNSLIILHRKKNDQYYVTE